MNEIRKKQKLIQQILLETSIEFYSLIFLDNYRFCMPLVSMIFHSFYILQIFPLYFNDFAMEIAFYFEVAGTQNWRQSSRVLSH